MNRTTESDTEELAIQLFESQGFTYLHATDETAHSLPQDNQESLHISLFTSWRSFGFKGSSGCSR
ncbi:hypothetical protein AGMMS50225_19520 [Betaproteobacteria bacterium]|nr:hypothetical protein AGMMS50225_19520 [Betaproteobacteria bacterium]